MNSDYRVVSNWHYPTFIKEIKNLLSEGWQCQGGIAIVSDNEGENIKLYVQAMIK